MHILRHLYPVYSPDEPATPEPEVVEAPVVEATPEPAVAEVAPEPEPEPEPKVEPEKPQHGNRGQTPWFQKTIAELRQERREERSAREAAEQRASELQSIIDRMRAGEKPEEVKPSPRLSDADFQAAVKAQAARDRLIADSGTVRDAGLSEFPDFANSLDILGPERGIGLTGDEFVAELLAVDKENAHKILDKLAKDPEKAASMVNMDSRRRIVELTRMAAAVAPKVEPKPAEVPKAPAVSKAPAPKPAVSPLAAAPEIDPTTPEGNEKMSDAQFEQWYKAKYMKRA